MNTVITHFYNEEYLLPWWINHHKKIFDNGIMINYNSTDRSVEICKQLCPYNWKIVNSVNSIFKDETNDLEVKLYENMMDGFKMTLTVTEFLIIPNSLNHLNEFMNSVNLKYIKTWGVCMVDTDPHNLPSYSLPLIKQKHHGMITGYNDPFYSHSPDMYNFLYGRFYHNDNFGKYTNGRHGLDINLIDNNQIMTLNNIFTLKYKYSPWNFYTNKRIKSYASKLLESEGNTNATELRTDEQRDVEYNHFLSTAHDLTDDLNFKIAYNYSMGL